MAEKDRLDGLQTLLSDMTTEELFRYIRGVRQERKIPQHRIEAKKKAKRKSKSALAELLKGMNPEELKAILGEVKK